VKSHPARRRSPAAAFAVILLALLATGGLYVVLAPKPSEAASVAEAQGDVEEGRALFLSNCSTCHGLNGEGSTDGPSLVGVGAAAVDFQVGTGRMPAYTSEIHQVPQTQQLFTQEQIYDMAAYVATLGPGPAIPTEEQYSTEGVSEDEIAEGGALFRTNCAMCHNAIGAGGALTAGKYAPTLSGVEPKYIYEAMLTGPQNMPVFGETLPEEEKQLIIAYLQGLEEEPTYGGFGLGNVGPVSEGLFAWVAGIGGLIAFAVWLGQKSS
jgi:ubiquinol-cytochrome c reductase cytochrome c subunit